jgi:hypothetical protein
MDSAWLSFLVYAGCLTFSERNPGARLRIPNAAVTNSFARLILESCKLKMLDIDNAIQQFTLNGDVVPLLKCYNKIMCEGDVTSSEFAKSEACHRDSFHVLLLKNLSLMEVTAEYKVQKVRKREF